MKKKLVISTGVVLMLIGVACFVVFQISKSRTFQFFGELYPRVETSQKFVALTFDDGPVPGQTDEILQILQEENVKATFFLIGSEIEKNPAELAKIMRAGHEIGNHTYHHERMMLVAPAFVKSEIEDTDELIRRAGYEGEILFRPPFGKKLFALPYYLSQHHRKTVTWDVEPETYFDSSADIVKYTLDQTKNGSIIIMHVMYPSRRESMKSVKPIIEGLRARGFEFATVSELLTLKN